MTDPLKPNSEEGFGQDRQIVKFIDFGDLHSLKHLTPTPEKLYLAISPHS
jgi:hypothetical protein